MFSRNRLVEKKHIGKLRLAERVRLEAEITDALAAEVDIKRYRNIDLASYVDKSALRRYLFGFLGDVSGKRVLDVCCGFSMTPVMMAMAGAEVVANDVSPLALKKVRRVAQMHGVEDQVEIYCGPAERLPYADKSFDLIYGGAAIHHLQIDAAGRELSRVLRVGGRGGFHDPLGHNLILEFARDNLNYRDKHPEKGTDRPLKVSDIEIFGSHFATYSWRGFGLIAMLPRLSSRFRGFKNTLHAIDCAMVSTFRPLQRYARFAVTLVAN